jgi:hypothetical protein
MKLPVLLCTLGSLCAAFAVARSAFSDTPASTLVPSGPAASTSQAPPLSERGRSQDNVHGLELVLSAGGGVQFLELGPFVPPAQYSAHFRGQSRPVRVVLRAEWLGSTTDLPFAPAAGSHWTLSLPDSWITGLPGRRYTVLAWDTGPGLGDADAAVFSYGMGP